MDDVTSTSSPSFVLIWTHYGDLSADKANEFIRVYLSICLSRYGGVPKDKDGRDNNNNNYYYFYDDEDVAWAATEVYDDETSCGVLCIIEMMKSISIVQYLLFSLR